MDRVGDALDVSLFDSPLAELTVTCRPATENERESFGARLFISTDSDGRQERRCYVMQTPPGDLLENGGDAEHDRDAPARVTLGRVPAAAAATSKRPMA